MEAFVTNEATGQQTRQHFDLAGSDLVPVPTYPGSAGTSNTPTVENPVNLTEGMLNNPITQQSQSIREQRAARPDPSVLATVGAAVSLWDGTRLFDRLARPTFDEDTYGFNPTEYKDHIGLVLDQAESDWFDSVAKGPKSAEYALEKIQARRTALDVVGDNPVLGTVVGMLDPAWLAVPPAIKIGRMSPIAGRVTSAAAGGAIAGGISSSGEGPLSDQELALSILTNAGASALFYKPGKGMVKADPAYPDTKMAEVVDNAVNKRTDVPDLAPELQPGGLRDGDVHAAVADAVTKDAERRGFSPAEALLWNNHKTMAKFGTGGKKAADLILDDVGDYTKHSMESHRAVALTSLQSKMLEAFDGIRGVMKDMGYGLTSMINPSKAKAAMQAQADVEKQVYLELLRRDQSARMGITIKEGAVDPRIASIADKVDELHRAALKEKKTAGVAGAENLEERSGYVHRVWSAFKMEEAIGKLELAGLQREKAITKVSRMVAGSLRRANGWEDDLSREVAQAIVTRALNKGEFEDSLFNGVISNAQLEQLRQVMRDGGMSADATEKALNRIRVNQDDAGKVGYLKHRVDLDYKATLIENGVEVKLTDLFDTRLTAILDRYTKSVATESAFARMGLKSQSDIDALRKEVLDTTPFEQRQKAAQHFDDLMAHFKGLPNGARMNDNMRMFRDYGRLISLTWGGLWQATELATAAGEYGMGKVLKYAAQEVPLFKQVREEIKSPETARSLFNVLTEHSEANLRIRPFMYRLEDGYDMPTGNSVDLSLQAAGQLVPYVNGMKYIHSFQARVTANLIIDRLDQAGRGNAKAQAALEKYGLKLPVLERIKANIDKHGYNVDAWDDNLWDSVRPAFGKMMDEAVLHARAGDLPAFVMFDNVGKFLFTYRNFSISAHNKLLAGGLARNGAGPVGMMLMYQMPLAYLAVEAQAAMTGKDMNESQLIGKAIGQMGGLGMFSDPVRWATGESSEFGAPGLIPADRGIKLLTDPSASNALNMVPLAIASPFVKAVQQQIKEE